MLSEAMVFELTGLPDAGSSQYELSVATRSIGAVYDEDDQHFDDSCRYHCQWFYYCGLADIGHSG